MKKRLTLELRNKKPGEVALPPSTWRGREGGEEREASGGARPGPWAPRRSVRTCRNGAGRRCRRSRARSSPKMVLRWLPPRRAV